MAVGVKESGGFDIENNFACGRSQFGLPDGVVGFVLSEALIERDFG